MPEKPRVLVDTSVWIDFLKGKDEAVRGLGSLMKNGRIVISGQVLQEVLQGSRNQMAFRKLADDMELWKMEPEQPEDFVEAARIFARLRWKGVTIPPSDCLIAAVAIRNNCPLYARDTDFEAIPGLRLFADD